MPHPLNLKTLVTAPEPKHGFEAKQLFHRDSKIFLRSVAKALGLQSSEFDLRSNKGGPAVSGEITLHTDRLYIQLSHSCMAAGAQVLFRTCDSRKDYTGHVNQFIQVNKLQDQHNQENWLKSLASMASRVATGFA